MVGAQAPSSGRPLWVALALGVFFLAIYAQTVAYLYAEFPHSYSWTELMLNYQGGFVKRAGLGELAYQLRGYLDPRDLIVSILFGAYAASVLLIVFGLGVGRDFASWLFLFSPAGLLFPVYEQGAFGRKDVFILCASAIALVAIWQSRSFWRSLAISLIVFLVAGILIEAAWFYFPLVVAALLTRHSDERAAVRISGSAAAACVAVLSMAMMYRSGTADTQLIAASWRAFIPDAYATEGALCCLGVSFDQAFGIMWASHGLQSLPRNSYVVGMILALIPIAVLLAKTRFRRIDWLTAAAWVAGILAALIPFVVAADWGRYIYLFSTVLFLAVWVGLGPRAASRPGLVSTIVMIALVIVFATSWRMLLWQERGNSALKPGPLVSAIGMKLD